MCGIVGLLAPPGSTPADRLTSFVRPMRDRITHRGPDAAGDWVDAEAGVALAHRRLSILDLTPSGSQPMPSATGRFVLVYNGEIYNHRALRASLEREGGAPAWRGHSDTEVLLAAIEHWGLQAALERCNGMFAFALWDRRERVLHLARDRAGEKPLYYGWLGGSLVFASELKALRAHPDWRGEIDRDVLALYFRYNYVPTPHCIYRGIRKLQPGTVLTVPWAPGAPTGADAGTVTTYWSASAVAERGLADPYRGSPEEATAELETLLHDAVGLRMEADVPLGAFLSGGIDSSVIVALMQAQRQEKVRTFSIGFRESDYDESDHARAVAAHLGTDHTELHVTPSEAQAVLPLLPSLYDEPFADVSQIPTYLVAQLARRDVTVSLSGDAGDEVFGGYNRYVVGRDLWRYVRRVPRGARRLAAAGLRGVSVERWNAVAHSIGTVLPAVRRTQRPGENAHKLASVLDARDPLAMYERLVTFWEDAEQLSGGRRLGMPAHWTAAQHADVDDATLRMMLLDFVSYLTDDILVKVDRATMGVSLEARVPFLDPRVVEFAWRLPLDYKIRGGVGKWIVREVLARHVPNALFERPKQGFGVPIGDWLRGPLAGWAGDLLEPARLRREGYLDAALVTRHWDEHRTGAKRWPYHLWSVLAFQAWLAEQ